jgi:single-strand DNA-binding protein
MAIISGLGRLGKDPKMSYTPKGDAQTHFPLAVRAGFGENEKTTWLSILCFGKQAETMNQYLKKGSRIDFVAELMELRTYEKKDGSTGYSLDAKLLKAEFVDGIEKSSDVEPEEF